MSIQSEINRIKGNVESSFSAVEAMGGTVPEAQTSDGLPAAIQSIPQGATYIAGDGIDITETTEGPKIGVTTPTRGIVTQAEFDALPEEQQNKGFYVISDGGGGSGGGGGESAGEVYSTEETRIGTWIDGRPLYRMVFKATSGDNETVTQFGTIVNLSELVYMYGKIHHTHIDGYVSIPEINVELQQIGDALCIYIGNIALANQPITVIAEYTKTTDEPTISTAEIVAASLDGLPEEDLTALAEAADAENVGPEVAL